MHFTNCILTRDLSNLGSLCHRTSRFRRGLELRLSDFHQHNHYSRHNKHCKIRVIYLHHDNSSCHRSKWPSRLLYCGTGFRGAHGVECAVGRSSVQWDGFEGANHSCLKKPLADIVCRDGYHLCSPQDKADNKNSNKNPNSTSNPLCASDSRRPCPHHSTNTTATSSTLVFLSGSIVIISLSFLAS
jgi:hypothetical protein